VRSLVDPSFGPANGTPGIDGGGLHRTQGGSHHLEIRIGLCSTLNHLLVSVQMQLLKVLIGTLDLKPETSREILLIANHHIHITGNLAVYLLSLGLATDRLPQRRPVVQVIGNHRAVFLSHLHGLNHHFGCRGRKRSKNSSGVKPAHAAGAKNIFPVNITLLQL